MTAVVIENTLRYTDFTGSGAEVTLITPNRAKKEAFISNDGYHSRYAPFESLIAGRVLLCCFTVLGLATGNAVASPGTTPSIALRRYTAYQLQNDVDLKQRQVAFLNRLRRADPERRTIERAVFNPQNELALILARSVELDKIPALMRSVLIQMAHEFPGQDLTVFAYAPSDPPRKIGTGRFNARTRDMTYTREH